MQLWIMKKKDVLINIHDIVLLFLDVHMWSHDMIC